MGLLVPGGSEDVCVTHVTLGGKGEWLVTSCSDTTA